MVLLQVQWLVSVSLCKLFCNIIQWAQLHSLVWRLYIVHCAAGGNNWVFPKMAVLTLPIPQNCVGVCPLIVHWCLCLAV